MDIFRGVEMRERKWKEKREKEKKSHGEIRVKGLIINKDI